MNRIDPTTRRLLRAALFSCVVLVLVPGIAHAAVDPYPIDNLLRRFEGLLELWLLAVQSAAEWLFWALATISLTWTMGMMVFRQADFGELFAELVRFVILTGIFWWLLISGGGADGLVYSILESMKILGERAANDGGDGGLRPAALLRSGYEVFFEVASQSSEDAWPDSDKIVGMMLATMVLALVALAAVSMMVVQVMFWLLAFGGLFLLGFGGARWSSGLAINYYRHVLAVGMAYFTMLLLAGTGEIFLRDYSDSVVDAITLPNLAIMLVATIVLLALLVRIPSMVSSIVLGSHFGGNDGGSLNARVLAMGGTAIANGVDRASNGAQALYAAYRSAEPAAATPAAHPTYTGSAAGVHASDLGATLPASVLTTQSLYSNDYGSDSGASVFTATAAPYEIANVQAPVDESKPAARAVSLGMPSEQAEPRTAPVDADRRPPIAGHDDVGDDATSTLNVDAATRAQSMLPPTVVNTGHDLPPQVSNVQAPVGDREEARLPPTLTVPQHASPMAAGDLPASVIDVDGDVRAQSVLPPAGVNTGHDLPPQVSNVQAPVGDREEARLPPTLTVPKRASPMAAGDLPASVIDADGDVRAQSVLPPTVVNTGHDLPPQVSNVQAPVGDREEARLPPTLTVPKRASPMAAGVLPASVIDADGDVRAQSMLPPTVVNTGHDLPPQVSNVQAPVGDREEARLPPTLTVPKRASPMAAGDLPASVIDVDGDVRAQSMLPPTVVNTGHDLPAQVSNVQAPVGDREEARLPPTLTVPQHASPMAAGDLPASVIDADGDVRAQSVMPPTVVNTGHDLPPQVSNVQVPGRDPDEVRPTPTVRQHASQTAPGDLPASVIDVDGDVRVQSVLPPAVVNTGHALSPQVSNVPAPGSDPDETKLPPRPKVPQHVSPVAAGDLPASVIDVDGDVRVQSVFPDAGLESTRDASSSLNAKMLVMEASGADEPIMQAMISAPMHGAGANLRESSVPTPTPTPTSPAGDSTHAVVISTPIDAPPPLQHSVVSQPAGAPRQWSAADSKLPPQSLDVSNTGNEDEH